jgi:trans-aconitate methyltransferase
VTGSASGKIEKVSASLPRMYTDLARWWPLLSPPEDYVGDAAIIAGLLRAGLVRAGLVRAELPAEAACPADGHPSPAAKPTLCELGSGGGHNAVHLARDFDLTLVDLAEPMLEVSRRLNPQAEHLLGDMRTIRLGRIFDAVLVHDAIDYMLSEDDLSAVFATARAHLAPGGVAVFMPDHVRESFEPGTHHGGTDAADGSGIRYLEWTWDPDPADTSAHTEYTLVMRDADGTIDVGTESHVFGLFPISTWTDLLWSNGFAVTPVTEHSESSGGGRTVFVGHAI